MFRGKKITFGKISANFGQNSKNDEPVESFGKFGKVAATPSKPVEIENLEDDLEHKEMKEIMGISGFGKKAKSFDVEEMLEQVKKTARQVTIAPPETKTDNHSKSESEDEEDLIGPPIPTSTDEKSSDSQENTKSQAKEKHGDESSSDDDSDDEDSNIDKMIPASHEVSMNHGVKAVTAISSDPSGARLATGSVDYDVCFWDFAGMDTQDRRKTSRKQMEKDRLDPVKSRRPDLPITSGQGGRVASSGGTLSSYVIRNLGLSKRVDDDQDPREAILKFAKEAAENPYWISPAYQKTQPKVILDGVSNEESNSNQDTDEPEAKKPKT
ncbi:uncharacterized protein CBL_11780 [Carabus blaptoides fortunei]